MTTVGFLARAALRRHWRGVLLLTLLVGISGAVGLSAVAGARRTASALGRFEQYSRTAHAEISVGDATAEELREFLRMERVEAVGVLHQLALQQAENENLAIAGAVDSRFGRDVDRARIIAGRPARLSVVDEVAIGEALASQLGVEVGDRLRFESFTPQQVLTFLAGEDAGGPQGPTPELRVVGIERRPLDLGARGASGGVVVVTPAFLEKYADQIGSFGGTILRVRARNGPTDLPQLTAAARRIFGGSPFYTAEPLGIDTEGARDAIDVLTVGLWTFAAVAGLAALVAVAIVLNRHVALTASDQRALRALGVSRRERIASAMTATAAPAALGGALFAVVGAALASPLFPFGVAHRAEPDPVFHLDATVLGLGGLVVLVVVAVLTLVAATRATSSASVATRRASATRGFAVPAAMVDSVPPAASVGLHMAFEPGRGRTAVPVRSAIVGATLGALGVIAVLTFASCLHDLATTPARYGWTWDLRAEDRTMFRPDAIVCGDLDSEVVRARSIDELTAICELNLEVDGHPVLGHGFTPVRGAIDATIVAGRAPRSPDEIALGASTLETIDKRIGDPVNVSGEAGTERYRIVGRVVLPPQGTDSEAQPLADGATFTGAGLARLDEPGNEGSTDFLLRFTAGTDLAAAAKRIDALPDITLRARGAVFPVEIERVQQVDWLLVTLAAFMGQLAVIAVGHALVTTVRRRRPDLAVLKTLGFSQRQVRATVASQATALSIVGLAIGVPLGVATGRFVWRLVADGLGVDTAATVPILGILATIAGGIVLANLTAALPARTAARTQPAAVLRSE